MIKKRNLFLFILLSIVTCGIYTVVAFCIMGKEINKICDGDGKKQMHFLLACLLGTVTLFIYPVIWFCKGMNRLQDNAYRYGSSVQVPHSGTSFALWTYLGAFIGVGPIVAWCQYVADVNKFAGVYGNATPVRYSSNMVERISLQKEFEQLNSNLFGNGSENQGQNSVDADKKTFAAPKQGTLIGVDGAYSNYKFPVDANEIVIGKDPSQCSIVIDSKFNQVSRKHAGVYYNPAKGVFVVKNYSSNGTVVEGVSTLQQNETVELEKGTIFNLGNNENRFRLM